MADSFVPEPDLHPLYPTPLYLDPLLAANSGLSPPQKHDLVQHSLLRACTFADLTLLSYLLSDSLPCSYVDLAVRDEDGLGLISTTILGFGGGSDRDLDREECVRLLVTEGADLHTADNAGWSPLHHAGLLSPPTLVSFLLKHGASPLALTRRGLTPLDIITAHSLIPGREAVAFLIEEAMREQGWSGGRMALRRRQEDERARRRGKRRELKQDVGKVLGLENHWWGEESSSSSSSSVASSDDEPDDPGRGLEDGAWDRPMDMSYSPPTNYTNMLVFSPSTLSSILDSLTYTPNLRPKGPALRCAEPARALYLLARFAVLACDESWLEDLMGGAVDRIERIVFAHPDHVALQAFWLFNTTTLLHFLRCDAHVSEICDILDLFTLLEGVIRAIYVFIIRIAERTLDPILDTALLEYAPLSSEFDSLQFEGEWSFLRSFTLGVGAGGVGGPKGGVAKLTKKKPESTPPPSASASSSFPPSASLNGVGVLPSPGPRAPSTSRPPSPSPSLQSFLTQSSGNNVTTSPRFSWAQNLTRARGSSLLQQHDGHGHASTHAHSGTGHTPTHSLAKMTAGSGTGHNAPAALTSQLNALHTLLTLAGVNPALLTQIWSQVMYWAACEMFNRILTRKKYLCRSRAIQIGMNLSVLEEWVVNSGLPHGVEGHFTPVRELVHWLQCSSSVSEFTTLVETIQTFKHLNPLQMRRAVRDYRFEVSESRMSEECAQYLVQLQKDWERRRVKLGVEALRREMNERERDRDSSISSMFNDAETASHAPSISTLSTEKSERSEAQRGIDRLFSRTHERAEWSAPNAPEALGELRDSRHMLPLVFPSDPRLLAAVPSSSYSNNNNGNGSAGASGTPGSGARTLQSGSGGQTPVGDAFERVKGEWERERGRSESRASRTGRGALAWRSRGRKLRVIGLETLGWVDGVRTLGRWPGGVDLRSVGAEGGDEEGDEEEGEGEEMRGESDRHTAGPHQNGDPLERGTVLTVKPRKASSSRRGNEVESSTGGDTAMPEADE